MDLDGASVPWSGNVRPRAVPGLATCLEEGRLYSGGSPLPVSHLEVEALCLAEWAVAGQHVLVLCPADPLAPLPELIAAAVHVADMTEQYGATGRAMGSSKRVAVVSTDFHARGFYRGLGVRPPRGLSAAPLRSVVPAGTLGRDGVVRILSADAGRGWSTVFVPSVADLREIGEVDLAIVELPAAGAERMLDAGGAVVIVARDPADPLLQRLGEGTLVFGWDGADVERVQDAGLPPRLKCRALGSSCELIAVPAHSVCENAALFWQDVGALVRAGSASLLARELAREAFGLFHDLVGLALPARIYEDLAGPIRVRLDALGSASRLTHGETRELYLPMVEAELRDLAGALGPVPPKHEFLLRTLRELLDDHRDVLFVARTAALARLYRSVFDDPSLAGVRVTSLGALSEEDPAEVALLTGMAPTWARWVYRAGIARTVRVLAYAPEGPLDSVAGGFNEVDMVRRVVADQLAREAWFGRPVVKDHAWSRLSGEPRRVPGDPGGAPPANGFDGVEVITPSPIDVPPGLWEGDRWLAPLEPGGAGAGGSLDGVGGHVAADAVVSAVRVTFEDGRWCLMDVAGSVTRFRAGSGTSDAAFPVARLKPGDHVLFFDGDSRKDLLGKVLEVAGEVPALAVAASWLSLWRQVLAAAYRRFGTFEAFAAALREQGCTVQTQTVRLWVVGVAIGPKDEEDVRRVGIVMEDAVLLGGHPEVCRAMRSLRGAHVRLGKRLSEIAREVGSAAAASRVGSDEVVDERTGLTAADFQESLDILKVRSIEGVGDVPYLVVGQLNIQEEGFDV